MTLEREDRVFPRHAHAVIRDPDPIETAPFEDDPHGSSPSVQRVLTELLDHRSGSLDDLASRDFVDQIWTEDRDPSHARAGP
jgi:hypothetical protein